jgi:hypothetical protein
MPKNPTGAHRSRPKHYQPPERGALSRTREAYSHQAACEGSTAGQERERRSAERDEADEGRERWPEPTLEDRGRQPEEQLRRY